MKISAIILILTTHFIASAQQELQEQSPDLLRKNKVKEIKLKFIKDTLIFYTKSETYNKFGFNTEDVIFRNFADTSIIYQYIYKSDTILKEKRNYRIKKSLLTGYTILDFNDAGKITSENYVDNNLKNASAYTNYSYDKQGRLSSYYHKRRYRGAMLMRENNLWITSITPTYKDTLYTNDTIEKITTKVDPSLSTFEYRYEYNKDNTIKQVNFIRPEKSKIIYYYDKNRNNISKIKKQDKKEFKTYECEYDSLNRPIVFHNYFESEAKIISIGGLFKVNNNDHLTTKVFYLSNGLIDYKEQYLNGHYFGKLEYIYTLKH